MSERRFGRRLMALLLILTVLQPPASAFAAKKKSPSTLVTVQRAVLYKSAKTSAEKLKTVDKGTKVTVVSTSGSWKKVKVAGKQGYMRSSAFSAPAQPSADATKKPKPTPKPKATPKATKKPAKTPEPQQMLAMRDAKLYKKAKTSSKSSSVEEGTAVSVLSQKGGWYRVKVSGKSGYMRQSAFEEEVAKKSKLYQKRSTKAKNTSLKAGAKLLVMEQQGDWLKVKSGARTGFVKLSALETPAPSLTPSLTPTPAPTSAPTLSPEKAAQAMKTIVSANMYQKPSTSAKRVKVKKGTKVTVVSKGDNGWYKVRLHGKNGYMKESAFVAPAKPTPSPTPKPTASGYRTLRSGSKGEAVKQLQQRLEALGYLDIVPSAKYGSSTVSAVRLFQDAANIKKTGKADDKTQQALFASGAPRSNLLSASLKGGSKGTQVKRLQTRLKSKGYFKARINGSYGDSTADAVKAFQRQARLTADGKAGSKTLARLYSNDAPSASDNPQPTATPSPSVKPTPAPNNNNNDDDDNGNKPPPASAEKKRKANVVIAAAMKQLGKPYVFGSTGMNSFDCSGFTMYAYKQVGISLPHSAYMQGYNCGTKISFSQLVRGDLVCWNTVSDGDLSDHVGIYLGDGQAIHASSGTGKVIISSITSGYYQRVFSWGRALF